MSFAWARSAAVLLLASFVASCATPEEPTAQNAQPLCGPGGCCSLTGAVDSTQPADGNYYLTSFGGGGFGAGCGYDTQSVACGGREADGCWYYAADRQRWGCHARLRLTRPDAPSRCVVVEVVDTGPDACVEHAAGKAIIDASPVVAHALFSSTCLGWSDARLVHADVVPATTPLGPCDQHGECASAPPAARPGTGSGTWTCSSDSSARARCIDNENIECEACAGGCTMHTAPTDSVCRAVVDAGSDAAGDAGSDAASDASTGSGDVVVASDVVQRDVGTDAVSDGGADAAPGDATRGDGACDGDANGLCRPGTLHGSCACRAAGARDGSSRPNGSLAVVCLALMGLQRLRRRARR